MPEDSTPPDHRALLATVPRQCGLVTMAQCRAMGLTEKAVRCKIGSGRWVAIHPGIYQTLPGRQDWHTTAMAALLACGEGAALALGSAAYIHGLVARAGPAVEVMVPSHRYVVPPAGVQAIRCRHLDRRVDEVEWPWRTTLENTILDLGARSSLDELIGLCARACQGELTTERLIRQELDRRVRHRWRTALVEALGDIGEGAESAAEVRYIRDVERAHGLPGGERQLPTNRSGRRRRHDNGYPAYQLIVEVDGRIGHDDWEGRQRDGGRDRSTAADGWLTIRVYWTDVAVTPCQLALELEAILRGRGWPGQATSCRRRDCALAVGHRADTQPDRPHGGVRAARNGAGGGRGPGGQSRTVEKLPKSAKPTRR